MRYVADFETGWWLKYGCCQRVICWIKLAMVLIRSAHWHTPMHPLATTAGGEPESVPDFLINAQHNRSLRRIRIQPNDITTLLMNCGSLDNLNVLVRYG